METEEQFAFKYMTSRHISPQYKACDNETELLYIYTDCVH